MYPKKDLVLMMIIKRDHKVWGHCHYTGNYRGAAHSICNLRYKTPKEISVVFHNGFTFDYHFIIKELAENFEGQFECLGENTEKYITFSVIIRKELGNGKTITHKLLIALDLRQPHYQNFLLIHLKRIAKNVEIKTANLSVSLKDLKITNFLIISKSVNTKNPS